MSYPCTFEFVSNLPSGCQINVRSEASSNARVISRIPAVGRVSVVAKHGDWLKVRLGGSSASKESWVLSKLERDHRGRARGNAPRDRRC